MTDNYLTYHGVFDYSERDSSATYEAFDWTTWVNGHVAAKEIKIDGVQSANIGTYVTAAESTYNALIGDQCPPEVAKDLSLLVLYDLVLLVDDSTSMDYEEIPTGAVGGNGAGPRIATLKKVLQAVADVYTHANPAGIVSVKFLNTAKGKSGVTGSKLTWFNSHSWGGVTRIGSELKRKILDQRVYTRKANAILTKPLLIITITDGAVEGERPELLPHTIINCVNTCDKDPAKGKGAVSFQFAQVGNDEEAAQFLRRLGTDDLTKDYVDCLLESTLDSIDLAEMKWEIIPQLLLGAITSRWRNHYVPVKIQGTAANIDTSAALGEYGEEDDADEDAF